MNGGSCQDLTAAYKCNCEPGFTGTHCEIGMCRKHNYLSITINVKILFTGTHCEIGKHVSNILLYCY